MLTEADKKWLEERAIQISKTTEYIASDYFCVWCKRFSNECTPWFKDKAMCPAHFGGDFRDAAEFEARVVVKALTRFDTCNDCAGFCFGDCCWDEPSCEATRLKYARLAVEEEMENE